MAIGPETKPKHKTTISEKQETQAEATAAGDCSSKGKGELQETAETLGSSKQTRRPQGQNPGPKTAHNNKPNIYKQLQQRAAGQKDSPLPENKHQAGESTGNTTAANTTSPKRTPEQSKANTVSKKLHAWEKNTRSQQQTEPLEQ
ncbi:hypothetical protein U1Q18_014789 [Sarracenia purpurea var. burkii]